MGTAIIFFQVSVLHLLLSFVCVCVYFHSLHSLTNTHWTLHNNNNFGTILSHVLWSLTSVSSHVFLLCSLLDMIIMHFYHNKTSSIALDMCSFVELIRFILPLDLITLLILFLNESTELQTHNLNIIYGLSI